MEILGSILEDILCCENPDYVVINKHYSFEGVDHDLWEFKAIIQEVSTSKFYSVIWYDSYVGWWECGLDKDLFELIEVFPKQVMTTIYE